MRKASVGFSLIELMVVMTIIAVLVTIALPRYQSSLDNAKLVALKSNLRALRQSIDHYQEDKARFPETLQALVEERYLKAIPIDPMTDSAQTWATIEETVDDAVGIADVRSGAKGNTPDGVPFSEL